MIDVSKPVYFYDDRNKYDYMLKLKEVLFVDEDCCLAMVTPVAYESVDGISDEKIRFSILNGQVSDSDYYSWIATNDVNWCEAQLQHYKEMNELRRST